MVRREMHKTSEDFNKEIENTKNYKTEIIELKNTITELKNSIEAFNKRLNHQTRRQGSGIQPIRGAKRKKKEKE